VRALPEIAPEFVFAEVPIKPVMPVQAPFRWQVFPILTPKRTGKAGYERF
jgi:hypothetical protein